MQQINLRIIDGYDQHHKLNKTDTELTENSMYVSKKNWKKSVVVKILPKRRQGGSTIVNKSEYTISCNVESH